MKNCSKIVALLVALLLVGAACQAVAATRIKGRASTEFEWFDNADEDTATPVYQYLLLNATDIAGSGWTFRGYGRLADDLSNEYETDSELYYAYLEKRGLGKKNLDLKLGRQFISTSAGASVMDGLYLKYNHLGPVDLAFFGGGDVKFDDNYSAGDLIVGGEISSDRLVNNLYAEFSYLQKWEDEQLGYELFGIDLDYNLPSLIRFYNEIQYSYLTDEVTYFILGAKYYRNPKWSLRTEYLYSLPVFSSTSIYSVFAVDEYQEALFEFDYLIRRGLNAFVRYTREFYESVDDANVFEAGVEMRRTEKFSGYLIGTYRKDDDGQDLKGIKARVAYLFHQKFEAGVGATIDVLERQIGFLGEQFNDEDDTTSQRYWVDATAYLTKSINLQGKFEAVKSDLWDKYYRGRLRLNYLF
ncbi:hypothetical protein EDC39_106198 [Geothermobacter ehrlichii]|uniref:Uncharacterized protein n=1 Tax=Geothermobacter ehrlichii TaxID=213224 RepID=A0A5D3WID3_9BACT|nr:hypothetical protein [Geothermobacter ehrlichii]TYO98592.1 hypothetical protein EDC39_106198 [Geothermobacter ehrlichii]